MPVCIVCAKIGCLTHREWGECAKHSAAFDLQIFMGCSSCLEEEGKPIYRPRLAEVCSLCETKMSEGDEIYTDGAPGCAICLRCGEKHGVGEWFKVRVKIGRMWTQADVTQERFK